MMKENQVLFVKDGSFDENMYDEQENDVKFYEGSHFTWRGMAVGLVIGLLLCCSNMYFGLQTGWVTLGSIQSSLLGFLIFKILPFQNFTPVENVLVQTAAGAAATMPLAAGFVSVLPALGMMTLEDHPPHGDHPGGPIVLSWWQLLVFALGLGFFGVFVAVPLRKQTIIREKLPFPSGTATSHMIEVLHGVRKNSNVATAYTPSLQYKWRLLACTFSFSAFYGIISFFIPVLQNIPIFTYMGMAEATAFSWVITPSLSYVGQGMIMGPRICLSMMFGAFFGWAFMGPYAKYVGWARGPVGDFKTGAKGWTLWISLAIMIAEALVSLGIVFIHAVYTIVKNKATYIEPELKDSDPTPEEHLVPMKWWIPGLIISMIICVLTGWLLFITDVPVWQVIIGSVLSIFVSVLAVRALGETDINPVSGVGKVTQLIFGLVASGNIVANLVAGAISEAGAQQAGDMMQDLKTGHLLRASPRAQFFAQLIGSVFSAFFSVGAYYLYTTAYPVPGDLFQVPTARIWLATAQVVNGGDLAPNVIWFCIPAAIIAAILPLVAFKFPKLAEWLPSGIAFAIGIYVTPNWTIPRVVGAMIAFIWQRNWPEKHAELMVIVASGFVLGEGITSIVTAGLKTAGVPVLIVN